MRVFVAGASGAIGRAIVPQLVAAEHKVTGTSRSEEKAKAISDAGARAAICDALDAHQLREAVVDAAPEAVIHELSALPERFDPRNQKAYEATNRLRSEGTRNLVEAARAAGARRLVCQSVAFAYAPGPPHGLKDEASPLFLDAPAPFGEGSQVILEMERAAREAEDLEGVVLRYGWFYGPGTYQGENGGTEQDVRRRRFPLFGRGSGVPSFIHIDDAAAATVAAVERGAPGVYNIVDDDPAPMREWLPAYAEAIGAKRPRRVPVWVARLAVGRMATFVLRQIGLSSQSWSAGAYETPTISPSLDRSRTTVWPQGSWRAG